MLLRYGAKNFFSFKEWMEIDLTYNNKVPQEKSSGANVAQAMCIKGANASGKTNAFRVLSFLSFFCANSFSLKPDETLPFDTFFNNNSPADFFVDFRIGEVEYSYEVSLTNDHIVSEKLYRKRKRRMLVLSRDRDKIKTNKFFTSKPEFPLRSNASVISTANQYEIAEFHDIYDFFSRIIVNVNYRGLQSNFLGPDFLASFYRKNPDALQFVKSKIAEFDTGITDIRIESHRDEENKEKFYPMFSHRTTEGEHDLPYYSQSNGTLSLYKYLVLYYLTLKQGGLLALDEFDTGLHPDILPHLVALFDNQTENPKQAQIIFSTHNTEIIDHMGKYRTYLFNKADGESYCYRLDELPGNIIRNDRPILPLYQSGKIGGVPNI